MYLEWIEHSKEPAEHRWSVDNYEQSKQPGQTQQWKKDNRGQQNRSEKQLLIS